MPKKNSTKLTLAAIKELTYVQQKENKVYETHWDNEIIGFGVRVFATSAKTFVYRYRQNGQTQIVTIGKFGILTLEQARIAAKKLAAQVASGESPAKEKKARLSKDKRTLSAVSIQYMEEYANKKKKPRSASRDEGLLRLHVLPHLGSMPITSVGRQDIRKLHHELGLKSQFTAMSW